MLVTNDNENNSASRGFWAVFFGAADMQDLGFIALATAFTGGRMVGVVGETIF